MVHILLLTTCLAQTTDDVARTDAAALTGTGLVKVETCRRAATFVAKDRQVYFLDVKMPGEPTPRVKLEEPADQNAPIALAKDPQSVFVTDGSTIYLATASGESTVVTSVPAMRPANPNYLAADTKKLASRKIAWCFATAPSRDFLYFTLMGEDSNSIGELRISSNQVTLSSVPVSIGVDVDYDARVAYALDPLRKRIIVVEFGRDVPKSIPVSISAQYCRLAPAKKMLLLSDHDLAAPGKMAVVDLVSGREQVLPVAGSFASWGGDGTLYFVRGSNSMWSYRLGSRDASHVLTIPGKPVPGMGLAPHVSGDMTWVAWGWTAELAKVRKKGTILIDIVNQEYRELRGWWYNVQWLGRGAVTNELNEPID
jgi:hypothetical protein